MTMSAAIEEAYASNTGAEVPIETIELDHVTFSTPAYFVTNVPDDMSLPLVLGGDPVVFKALPFTAILPGMTETGPTPMKLRVKDLDGVLTPYLNLAVQATEAIQLTYRVYSSEDLTQPGDVIEGLTLNDVDQDGTGAEGTVGFKEIELQAFPLASYDEQYYPNLQNP